MKFPVYFAALLVVVACLAPAIGLLSAQAQVSAQAQDPPPALPAVRPAPPMVVEPEERRSRAQRSTSLSDAVRRVQRETGGEVLGAERIQYDGREINRVKVLDRHGRVRSIDGDPQRERGVPQDRDSEREAPPPPSPARNDNRQ